MHDTTISAIDMQVAIPEDKSHVILAWIDGLLLPTAQGMAQIPTGRYQAPMDKGLAIKVGNALLEAAEMVVEAKPQIETAGSMAEAEKVARQEAAVRSLREGIR